MALEMAQSRTVEAQDTLAHVEHAIREATRELDGNWTMVAGADAPATYNGGISSPYARRMTNLMDRDNGRYWPYYFHEYQLRAQRAVCRQLGTFTAVAVGAMQALQVYVMGGEWEYEAVPKYNQDVPDAFIEEVQKCVDEILEKNDFIGCLDNEIHDASREDGDTLVALYAAPDGICDIRRTDADCLREPKTRAALDDWLGTGWATPTGKPAFDWSFGVLTGFDERMKRIDHARPLGYHICFDEDGREYDFLPAWPMQGGDLDDRCGHLVKRNVPAAAKRGISDYFSILNDLEREDKLNTNLSVAAAAIAAIAWIEEMPTGTTRDQAESSLNNALDEFSRALTANKRPGDTRTVQNLKPGSVPRVSNGRQYKPAPVGQRGSEMFIAVRQAIVRRIETRWLMPEYLITADASNANYASTLVSGTPFVKAREGDQGRFKQDFREILFRALKFAHDAGRFRRFVPDWTTFVSLIELVLTPPPIASEDKKTLIEQLFGTYDRGAMDANEMRVALRMEPKEELEGKTGSGVQAPGTAAGGMVPTVGLQHTLKLESIAARALRELPARRKMREAFCATGEKGGSDNSCAPPNKGTGTATAATGKEPVKTQRGEIEFTEAEQLVQKVREAGGFTYQPVDNTSPTKGYAVAAYPGAEKIYEKQKLSSDDIFNYLKTNADKFDDPETHVGGWADNGNVFLDLSVVKNDLNEAKALGIKHDQLAIFDLGNFNTIEVESARTLKLRKAA